MKKLLILLITIISLAMVTGCNLISQPTAEVPTPTIVKEVDVQPKSPTATNFPRVGTPTPVPPTATSQPTPTPTLNASAFDDATTAELMAGTISAAGIDAEVEIVEEGDVRTAYITIVSEYNIADSELLLKLFVLETGNALRTARAFTEGSMQADLDAVFITVNDKQGQLLGTVSAEMPDVVRFLDGDSSVDEAFAQLTLTGVFETFLQ